MSEAAIITGIRQKTVVGAGGKIEIVAPDLPQGIPVEVIVFVESVKQDSTEYLLSTAANRQHLLQAVKELQDRSQYVFVNTDAL